MGTLLTDTYRRVSSKCFIRFCRFIRAGGGSTRRGLTRLTFILLFLEYNMAKEVDAETWYIHVDGEPKGPLSIRDIDVLIRTNEITSKTLGWKAGMKEWKPLIDIDEIKDSIQESSK